MESTKKTMRIALIQPIVTISKQQNLKNKEHLIREAVSAFKPRIVTLPEFFNSPYLVEHMRHNAESIPDGESCKLLSRLAKEFGIYLVGGSIPELDGSNVYNTTTVWSPTGDLIAKHRKVHMADCAVTKDTILRESDVLSPGNSLNMFEVDGVKIGLGICYDAFFPELSILYRKKGCDVILFQSAFPVASGHYWDLVLRARALDNQVFVVGTSGARGDETTGFPYWGHSCVADPDGVLLKQAGIKQEIIYCDIDFSTQNTLRTNIPMFKQKRTDIYETINKK